MWRLDTALNWKNSMLFWHKKITYECPDCDPEYVPECEPGKVWDETTQQCIVPPCQPWDEFYECDCKCEEWQECRDWKCYDIEEPKCEEPYVWDPVTKTCVEPPTPPTPTPWPTPVDPPECWDCYMYDSDTWKCKWDITKCPESTPWECPNDKPYDEECWCCKSKKPEEPIPVTPEQDDCIKYTNVWNWVIVNEDWKITWAYWSSRLNWRRYWFSTDCIDRVEFYARITTVWEWANKSWIEHWYAETLWDMTYTVQAYYWDYVQLHHNDVLKIIIYSDWREDTYIKSFIRDWVWTDWELFSLIKKPEAPAWKIKWLMCWVLWWAEIWDIKTYWWKEITVLYSWEWWEIIHDITNQEITLTKSNWQSITIMDRNVWATKYYNESWATANDWNWSLFQWWNNYWFTNIPSTSKDTVDTTWYSWRNPYSNNVVITSNKHPTTSAFYKPDWSSPSNSELWWSNTDTGISKQWPCPEWYHIPNVYEALNLLNTWSSITWVDRTSYWYNHSRLVLFEDTLLLPLNWGIEVSGNTPYVSRWGIWLLWTTTDTRYDNIPYGAAYRVAFNDYYIQTYTEGSSYMWQAYAKIWWFGIRPFKN